MFATRIWHWRKKCYLNASDYGLKAFPIRRGRWTKTVHSTGKPVRAGFPSALLPPSLGSSSRDLLSRFRWQPRCSNLPAFRTAQLP